MLADKIDDSKFFSMRKESFAVDPQNPKMMAGLNIPRESYRKLPIANEQQNTLGDYRNLNPSPIFVFPENQENKSSNDVDLYFI